MLSSRAVTVVLYVVLGVWVASVFLPLAFPDFQSGPISTVFMTIAGLILGREFAAARKQRRDQPAEPDAPNETPHNDGTPTP